MKAEASPAATLAYRLASPIPEYWIPLLPVRADGRGVRLQRGALLGRGRLEPVEPRSRILMPGERLQLHEEEVPRAGARVIRAYQYARWIDGSTHLWMSRSKGAGRGEAASGLRFDALQPPGESQNSQ
ncbi:MAG: hypothetical protein ACRDI2_02035 [Chloroflexota bacterium]